jgi:hypothetical protein
LFSRSIYNTNSSNPVRKTTCIESLCWSANPLGHQMSTIQKWPWYELAPDTIEQKNTEKNRGKKQKMSMHNRKKETERISYTHCTINTHWDTNASSINTVTETKKQRNKLSNQKNLTKRSEAFTMSKLQSLERPSSLVYP